MSEHCRIVLYLSSKTARQLDWEAAWSLYSYRDLTVKGVRQPSRSLRFYS